MTRFAAFMTAAMIFAIPAAHAGNRDALCSLLPVEHNVVPAEYVPGVDVHGNAVVPADLTAQQMMAAVDYVTIPVTIDLAQDLQQTLPAGTEMNAQVAMIEVHKDGQVVYNGQDVTPRAYALCGKEQAAIEPAGNDRAGPAVAAAPVVPSEPPPKLSVQATEEDLNKPVTMDDIIWGEGN